MYVDCCHRYPPLSYVPFIPATANMTPRQRFHTQLFLSLLSQAHQQQELMRMGWSWAPSFQFPTPGARSSNALGLKPTPTGVHYVTATPGGTLMPVRTPIATQFPFNFHQGVRITPMGSQMTPSSQIGLTPQLAPSSIPVSMGAPPPVPPSHAVGRPFNSLVG